MKRAQGWLGATRLTQLRAQIHQLMAGAHNSINPRFFCICSQRLRVMRNRKRADACIHQILLLEAGEHRNPQHFRLCGQGECGFFCSLHHRHATLRVHGQHKNIQAQECAHRARVDAQAHPLHPRHHRRQSSDGHRPRHGCGGFG